MPPQRHGIHHKQEIPGPAEPALQDIRLVQRQLDKGVTSVLAFAGFDSVTGSALHSLEALAEEFITQLLESTCVSMLSARRSLPTAPDFIFALDRAGIDPSQLQDQLTLPIPHDLSCPILQPPAPAEPPPVDLRRLLGSDLCEPAPQSYPHIPAHFPALPSKHAWRCTEQVAARLKDPRKLREKATQEGILAEQALRKLAQAASKPRTRRQRTASKAEQAKEALWNEAMACLAEDVLRNNTQAERDIDTVMVDGSGEGKVKTNDAAAVEDKRAAMVVNYDRVHWRKSATLGSARG